MTRKNNFCLAILWIFIGTMGRLIPHPANVTPLTNLSLFAGSQLSRRLAFGSLFISLIFSDITLHYLKGYPFFGWWTIFTYSGLAMIMLAGSWLSSMPSKLRLITFVLFSSLGFWLWSNFGVWLEGALYPRTFSGLISCYIAAIPFLRNALIGDLVWMVVIFGGYRKLVILSVGEGSIFKKKFFPLH